MSLLRDRTWKLKYTPDDGDLVRLLYVPALECAVRYDRLTGYFQSRALALASRGVECLVRNNGRMRLLVGCTLDKPEVDAITKGAEWRDQLKAHLIANPLRPKNQHEVEALELLAWMVANQIMEVKVAVPCDEQRRPIPAEGLFHEKAGIIEDKTGDRLAFNGSLNETATGWTRNWESLNVFRSWAGDEAAERVIEEDKNFLRLWGDESKHVVTVDVPEAAKADLLRFLPASDRPARLARLESRDQPTLPASESPAQSAEVPSPALIPAATDCRRAVWSYIRHAANMPVGGERVGEATANVMPWPHQIRAFHRLYQHWPPKLLIADEVGLGKTIQAGLLIRQAWLAEKANRVLVLAPANVCRQWQLELREKFNLSWPIYDGEQLVWLKSAGRADDLEQPVGRGEWHKQPAVIVSSHLMRRSERQPELLEQAEPWDLIIVDEAHHARRKAPGQASEGGPNALLRLLQRLKERTKGLVLLTATPMQVHPVEVWDLLALFGLPPEWDEPAFLKFSHWVENSSPSHEAFDFLAGQFRAMEARFGAVSDVEVKRAGASSGLQVRKILSALRDQSNIPRRQLEPANRAIAQRVMRTHSPIRWYVSRHTRDLLRRYYKAGKISTPIADRVVDDQFVNLSPAERDIYDKVENYISSTYDQASAKEKNAVGFVMTIYRRRLASSFAALRHTLENRFASVAATSQAKPTAGPPDDEADIEVIDSTGDLLSPDDVSALEREAFAREEKSEIERILGEIRLLPPDSKAGRLVEELNKLRAAGYAQAMVFTQYTDTMDFLRGELSRNTSLRVMCFSGRGGEVREKDGSWRTISRDDAKRRFREGHADVLLCTDAAAEGLNFQFCGALVNYDMPWNPMRVEQRIGRIDRLGQRHQKIRIINLHYADTVETDVYLALRKRIGLFESVVGRLQPILAQLPSLIATNVLSGRGRDPDGRAAVAGAVEQQAQQEIQDGFDLDGMLDADLEEPARPAPALSLADLERVLAHGALLPAQIDAKVMQAGEFSVTMTGRAGAVRVTTRAEYFDEHAESMELWSAGSPVFPNGAIPTDDAPPTRSEFDAMLNGAR